MNLQKVSLSFQKIFICFVVALAERSYVDFVVLPFNFMLPLAFSLFSEEDVYKYTTIFEKFST